MTGRQGCIRAVVFDLDDTLYLERNYVRGGFAAVAEHLRRRLPSTGLGERGGRADLAGWMWRRFLRGRRAKMLDALNERFALGLSRSDIRALVRVYRHHRPAIRPCRGVPALLGRLRLRGLRLGLLSDGFLPAQRLKLSALGLGEFFDAVIFTGQMGRSAWKPSPAGFERIRRRLGVPHAACAYVADNPAKDFLAPNRLGWLSVQWRRRGQVHADSPAPPDGRPRRTVRSIAELVALVSLRLDGAEE